MSNLPCPACSCSHLWHHADTSTARTTFTEGPTRAGGLGWTLHGLWIPSDLEEHLAPRGSGWNGPPLCREPLPE
jgi:hypothetical protein